MRAGSIVVRAAAFAACLPALATSARAQEALPAPENYHLRGEYRQFLPKLDSQFQKGEGGTLLDAKDDLDVQDENTFQIRGVLQMSPGHKLRGSFTRIDYKGDVAHNRRAFLYGGTQYDRNERVASELKGNYFSVDYEWDFYKGPHGYFGGLLGAKVIDVDTVIAAPDSGKRVTDTQRAPVPVIGVVGRGYLARLSFEGEISGISIGDKGNAVEADLSARIHLADRIAVSAGYRYVKIHYKDTPDAADFKLDGVHFGVELSL